MVHFSLFMTPFQFVFGALCISFSRCSSLDIGLFTYAFSLSLSRSSRRFLLILASFLTLLRVFVDSLDIFYFLLSLAALSLSAFEYALFIVIWRCLLGHTNVVS